MGLSRHPVVYLVATNLLFWGVPIAINQMQSMGIGRSAQGGLVAAQSSGVALEGLMAKPMDQQADPLLTVAAGAGITSPLLGPSLGEAPASGIAHGSPAMASTAWSAQSSSADYGVPPSGPVNLLEQLNGADGLGGVLTLKSSAEPLMPIAARAEQLQRLRSGDPLGALPLHWREPLRRELAGRKGIGEVATVRLPVRALKERQEVPVIVDETGQAEGLVMPRDQQVRAAVEGWASRQKAAKPGTVQVVVLAAEPLDAEPDPAPATVAVLHSAAQPSLSVMPPPPLP